MDPTNQYQTTTYQPISYHLIPFRSVPFSCIIIQHHNSPHKRQHSICHCIEAAYATTPHQTTHSNSTQHNKSQHNTTQHNKLLQNSTQRSRTIGNSNLYHCTVTVHTYIHIQMKGASSGIKR